MNHTTLIVYQSKTGFTERYAQQIARETGARLLPLAKASPAALAGCDAVLFGSRAHAGRLDGWAKGKRLLAEARAKGARCAVFATGATPAAERATVEQFWAQSLTAEEQAALPHFYLQSGLCYEKMSLLDRLMMKSLAVMLRGKQDKTPEEAAMQRMIAGSFDNSGEEYALPVIEWIRAGE